MFAEIVLDVKNVVDPKIIVPNVKRDTYCKVINVICVTLSVLLVLELFQTV